MAVSAGTRNHFSFCRIYGLTIAPEKKWYSLSSQLVGEKVSQFVEGKFFQLFRSEICSVQVDNLWRENGYHVPKFWLKRGRSLRNNFVWPMWGGLIKQSSSECHGFLYSDVFKRVMETVNNVDVGEFGAGSLPGVQAREEWKF